MKMVINATARAIGDVEEVLASLDQIDAITSFIGRGTIRFAATVRPEQPNPDYAHLLIRVADVEEMDAIMASATGLIASVHPDAELIVRRSEFSPSGASKLEARFAGPDADTLRALADEALATFVNAGLSDIKTDWRQRTGKGGHSRLRTNSAAG